MLKKVTRFGAKNTRILCRNSQNMLYYESTFHQSNDTNPVGISKDNMTKLFGSDTVTDSLQSTVKEEMLTRSDFGFYQRLLPIDTVQDIIHNMNFLFDIPYWLIVLGLPFATKALMTIPIHFHQQRKYESRLTTLPMAVYEMHCITNKDITSRKRGTHNYDDMLKNRRELKNKYGYNATTTQLLPYTAAMVQIPIHLTMFIAIRTINTKYPLWSEGGPLHLSNLSVVDTSYVLPISIGCTMAILQFMVFERNKNRGAGLNTNALMGINGAATVAIAYLAINWSIGFNLYILSNLASYTVQLGLMDITLFRNIVGLKAYSLLKQDVKKLQIIYECHRIIMQQQTTMKQEYVQHGGDTGSLHNRFPRFETAAIALLQDPANFKNTVHSKGELDAVLDDIANIDIEIDNEDDEEDHLGEGKQYSFEFTSQDDIDSRRRQIQKTLKGSTMRSFLMSQKEAENSNDDDIDNEEDDDNEEYHEKVIIHDVDQEKMAKNKKYDD